MPKAQTDAAPTGADPNAATTGDQGANGTATTPVSTVDTGTGDTPAVPTNDPPASPITGLSRLLAKAADAAVFGNDSLKAPALSALAARMDEVVVALPAALAAADSDLKAALTALSDLLN